MDLFPLFSWLSTGGKCRYCKEPVSIRYFLVEVFCGGIFAALWWQYLIAGYEPLRMAFYMAATACLVAIIFIDWELFIIPDEINALLLAIGIGMQAMIGSLGTAFWGALAGWGILWGIAFFGRLGFGKDAMGHGDIKMMRGVGALLGPTLLIANMGIAVLAGLIIGIAVIVIVSMGKKVEEAEPIEDADLALKGFGWSDHQVQTFKAAADKQGRPWPAVVLAAKAANTTSHEELMAFVAPESIGSLLKCGVFYLLCLDIVGVFWKGVYRVIGETYVEEDIEDDTWAPSLTTIPFGPYLAVGALACMIFAGPIERGLRDYWDSATGRNMAATVSHKAATAVLDPK
jgi:leader peptidase (prepilin peptidase)/N-methyltransferase